MAWGVIGYRLTGQFTAPLVLHTMYEAIEGQLFPDASRDVSMRNHLGDTIAFAAGLGLAAYIEHGEKL